MINPRNFIIKQEINENDAYKKKLVEICHYIRGMMFSYAWDNGCTSY